MGKVLWPSGTEDSQQYQIAQLQSALPNITLRLLDNINAANYEAMTNLSSFLTLASTGEFSTSSSPSLSNSTDGLYTMFNTYLVSTALAQNGWDAVLVANANPQQITTNPSVPLPTWALYDCTDCPNLRNLNCEYYDENGQCNYWWYSNFSQCAYTLGGHFGEDAAPMMSKLFIQGFTTGSLLFENAAICDTLSFRNFDTEMVLAPSLNNDDIVNNPENAYMNWVIPSLVPLDPTNPSVSYISENPYESRSFPNHPSNTLYNQTFYGLDYSCASQLNLSIMTTWYDVYHKLFP